MNFCGFDRIEEIRWRQLKEYRFRSLLNVELETAVFPRRWESLKLRPHPINVCGFSPVLTSLS